MFSFNLKFLLRILPLFLLVSFALVSCGDDEDTNPTPTVEDGMYIKGAGTAFADFSSKALFTATKNEVNQAPRAELFEVYMAVKAGSDGFNIVKVNGTSQKVYGPGSDWAAATPSNDEPKNGLWKGALTESASKFTVPEDGLYHIVVDLGLNKVAMAKADWGVIGAATPGGWSDNTAMPTTFDLNKMVFKAEKLVLLANEYKFRYSNGWKIELDNELDLGNGVKGVKANSNFGGTLTSLDPGGANIQNAVYGEYTVTLTWEAGVGYSATATKTGDGPVLPTYPDAMYLVGDATAYAWDTPGTKAEAIMHKAAGGAPSEGIFWKIAYLETGKGFKVSAADWKAPNLGFGDVKVFDVDGAAVSDSGGNMSVAESGMYMIVLNLRDNNTQLSVKPAEVYGIGDAFGSWDEDKDTYKFTVDNTTKNIVSPALAASANIRMYAQHPWIPAWWNAEFRVNNGVIEYRNDGGDQDPVAGTAGQKVTLHFDDNTGSIQ